MISYELALGLSLIGVILLSGTLDIYNIVEQQSGWYGMQLEHLLSAARFHPLSDRGDRGNESRAV